MLLTQADLIGRRLEYRLSDTYFYTLWKFPASGVKETLLAGNYGIRKLPKMSRSPAPQLKSQTEKTILLTDLLDAGDDGKELLTCLHVSHKRRLGTRQ